MSLSIPSANVLVRISAPERNTGGPPAGLGETLANNVLEYLLSLTNGTGSGKVSVLHFRSYSSATAVVVDLYDADSPTDPSATVAIPVPVLVAVKNRSTTTGQYLTVGAGTAPMASLFATSGDGVICHPGGLVLLSSPLVGYATVENTADRITITPATGTVPFDVMVLGRAS